MLLKLQRQNQQRKRLQQKIRNLIPKHQQNPKQQRKRLRNRNLSSLIKEGWCISTGGFIKQTKMNEKFMLEAIKLSEK
jgi:regulator of replication initiation timing